MTMGEDTSEKRCDGHDMSPSLDHSNPILRLDMSGQVYR